MALDLSNATQWKERVDNDAFLRPSKILTWFFKLPCNGVQRGHLKTIVDSAMDRSLELGDSAIALAVKELHEESLQDPAAEDILDTLLVQKQTQGPTIELKARIGAARMKRAITKAGEARNQLQGMS